MTSPPYKRIINQHNYRMLPFYRNTFIECPDRRTTYIPGLFSGNVALIVAPSLSSFADGEALPHQ